MTAGVSTLSGSCADTGTAPERVFQWTPAVSGTATIQTCSGTDTDYDTVLYLRSASCAGGPEIACNDDTAGCFTSEPNDHHGSRVTPTVTAGQTYFIIVDGYAGRSGTFSLSVDPPTAAATPTPSPTSTSATSTPTAPTPTPTATPGSCDAPVVVPAAGGTFTAATAGTGTLAGSCANSASAPEKVFQWTPVVSGTATIQTCSGADTDYDTVLYLRSASCAGGPEIACNDDTAGCFTSEPNDHHGSRVTPTVTAGQTYFIIVDGYAGRSGTFSLSVDPPTAAATPTPSPTSTSATSTPTAPTPTPTAAPGSCGAPVVVAAAGGTFTGTNAGANALAGTCALSNNSPETVFAWTSATSGNATLATCGSATTFDTVMYVRTGSCTGIDVACNDDTTGCTTGEPSSYHGSQMTIPVSAGETYFIVVDGYNGASGTFSLSVTPG